MKYSLNQKGIASFISPIAMGEYDVSLSVFRTAKLTIVVPFKGHDRKLQEFPLRF